VRLFLMLAVIAQLLTGPAFAQDRPLFQPFRIGYPASGSFGDRLKANAALTHDLRRIGLIVSWHSFGDGLEVLRALHADAIDVALDIASHEVVLAKLEELAMVFVAEQKACDNECDADTALLDEIGRRYTLTSEYIAERREDALLVTFRALAQSSRAISHSVNLVTRPTLAANQQLIDDLLAADQTSRWVDAADVNYWAPS
jgi:hypothetical protein